MKAGASERPFFVIPAKAGILTTAGRGSRLRRNDGAFDDTPLGKAPELENLLLIEDYTQYACDPEDQ